MSDLTSIYERALDEQFERDLMYGVYTPEKLKVLIENRSLSQQQLQIILELAPSLGGGFNNLTSPQQQQLQQKNAPAVNQAPQQQQANNQESSAKLQFQKISQLIQNSKLYDELNKLKTMSGTDQSISQGVDAIMQWFDYLKNKLFAATPAPAANTGNQNITPQPQA